MSSPRFRCLNGITRFVLGTVSIGLCVSCVYARCANSTYFTEQAYIQHGNKLSIATITFGAISILSCISVILVIFAYKKDQRLLRERIIVGLMCANILYSAGNTAPMFLVYERDCTSVLSEAQTVWVRAVWLCGKYWIVCYEIFIVGTAVHALRNGSM